MNASTRRSAPAIHCFTAIDIWRVTSCVIIIIIIIIIIIKWDTDVQFRMFNVVLKKTANIKEKTD